MAQLITLTGKTSTSLKLRASIIKSKLFCIFGFYLKLTLKNYLKPYIRHIDELASLLKLIPSEFFILDI